MLSWPGLNLVIGRYSFSISFQYPVSQDIQVVRSKRRTLMSWKVVNRCKFRYILCLMRTKPLVVQLVLDFRIR